MLRFRLFTGEQVEVEVVGRRRVGGGRFPIARRGGPRPRHRASAAPRPGDPSGVSATTAWTTSPRRPPTARRARVERLPDGRWPACTATRPRWPTVALLDPYRGEPLHEAGLTGRDRFGRLPGGLLTGCAGSGPPGAHRAAQPRHRAVGQSPSARCRSPIQPDTVFGAPGTPVGARQPGPDGATAATVLRPSPA